MTTSIPEAAEPEHDPVITILTGMSAQLDRIEQRLQQITGQPTAPAETDTDQENPS